MLELMKKYNLLCKRYAKAEEYFNRREVSLEEKQRQAEPCKALIDEMAKIGNQIESKGYVMDSHEVLGGFRQVEYFEKEGIL